MVRRTKWRGPAYPDWWEAYPAYRAGRREMSRGTPLKITGERGEFRFWDYVKVPEHDGKPEVEWITVTGPYGFRSFRPERIGRVLRTRPGRQRSR
jgi:hypothetical protein